MYYRCNLFPVYLFHSLFTSPHVRSEVRCQHASVQWRYLRFQDRCLGEYAEFTGKFLLLMFIIVKMADSEFMLYTSHL